MRGLILKRGLEEQPGRPEAQRLVPVDVFSDITSQNVKPWIRAGHGYAEPYSNSVFCCYPSVKEQLLVHLRGNFQSYFTFVYLLQVLFSLQSHVVNFHFLHNWHCKWHYVGLRYSELFYRVYLFRKFCFHNTPLACRKGQQERRGLEVLIIKEFRSLH